MINVIIDEKVLKVSIFPHRTLVGSNISIGSASYMRHFCLLGFKHI